MRILHAGGVAGARTARGVVVVIDVLRAFTVSAYALAGAAREVILVGSVERARALGAELGALVSAEEGGLPVAGVEISNSPAMVRDADLAGRVLVQRSTSGVQAALAAPGPHVFAASLVVAGATARAVSALAPSEVTLVASGAGLGHAEDRACADLIEASLLGRPAPVLDDLLAPVYRDDRYRRCLAGAWPGCPPADMALSLALDTFDFAMTIRERAGLPGCVRLDMA